MENTHTRVECVCEREKKPPTKQRWKRKNFLCENWRTLFKTKCILDTSYAYECISLIREAEEGKQRVCGYPASACHYANTKSKWNELKIQGAFPCLLRLSFSCSAFKRLRCVHTCSLWCRDCRRLKRNFNMGTMNDWWRIKWHGFFFLSLSPFARS